MITDNALARVATFGAEVGGKSPADGYTVLFGIDTTLTVNGIYTPRCRAGRP